MKEAYSSNLERINTVLTIVLAVFTILGVLGLGGLWKIVGYFRNELNELISLKVEYQTKFAEIGSELKNAKIKFEEITKVNEEQETRLKIIEIQGKARESARNGDYLQAINYLDVALEKSPEDLTTLSMKKSCLSYMGKYPEALDILNSIIRLDGDKTPYIAELLELNLLIEDIAGYESLLSKYYTQISTHHSGYLIWYVESLKFYLKDDTDGLKKNIELKKVQLESDTEKQKKMGWLFYELRFKLTTKRDTRLKVLLLKQIDYIEGNISGKELFDYLASIG